MRYVANAIAVDCTTNNCLLTCHHSCCKIGGPIQNLCVSLPTAGDVSTTQALTAVKIVVEDDERSDLVVLQRTDSEVFPQTVPICPYGNLPVATNITHELVALYANVHDFVEIMC